jgi:hypothetical protein
MLKTKVICWFCNQENKVFFFRKNSWTCPYCCQYNGFNKDGDYNKVIPEMYTEKPVEFCKKATKDGNIGSSNILCDMCNQRQEQKMAKLKEFEDKNCNNVSINE